MKTLVSKITTAITFVLFFAQSAIAQSTCQSPKPMDEYLYPGQYMDVFFTTAWVPNDNATSGAPSCITSVGTGGQRWYSLSLPNTAALNVTLTTQESSSGIFDTKLHVYTGSCGSLVCVTGDDDSGPGNYSLVNFTAQPNTTYLVRVGGYAANEGVTNITMDAGEPGCTDYNAQNYDWTAEWNNGTCCYEGYSILTLSNNGNQPWENVAVIRVDNVDLLTIHPGWTGTVCAPPSCDFKLIFNDTNGGTWGGTTYSLWVNGILYNGTVPTMDYGTTSTVIIPICGCTDIFAANFDPQAQYDDGSCCYPGTITINSDSPGTYASFYVDGWPVATVYPGGTTSFCAPRSCNTFIYSDNFSATAAYTVDYQGEIFTGNLPIGYFQYTTLELSTCGCTDPAAYNYEPTATMDNGSCYFVANATCDGAILLQPNEAVFVNTVGVPTNINPNVDCGYVNGSPSLWYKFVYNGGTVRFGTLYNDDTVLGIFDGCDGNNLICMDDPFIPVSGGGSAWQVQVQQSLSCADGLVKGQTYYVATGLLSSEGDFHLHFEQFDNPGCTDPLAANYNSCASLDDGSCMAATNNCPADLDGNGTVNVSDLLLFMSEFGSNCGI